MHFARNNVWQRSELGINFNEIKNIIDKINFDKIGVCLDTSSKASFLLSLSMNELISSFV